MGAVKQLVTVAMISSLGLFGACKFSSSSDSAVKEQKTKESDPIDQFLFDVRKDFLAAKKLDASNLATYIQFGQRLICRKLATVDLSPYNADSSEITLFDPSKPLNSVSAIPLSGTINGEFHKEIINFKFDGVGNGELVAQVRNQLGDDRIYVRGHEKGLILEVAESSFTRRIIKRNIPSVLHKSEVRQYEWRAMSYFLCSLPVQEAPTTEQSSQGNDQQQQSNSGGELQLK